LIQYVRSIQISRTDEENLGKNFEETKEMRKVSSLENKKSQAFT